MVVVLLSFLGIKATDLLIAASGHLSMRNHIANTTYNQKDIVKALQALD